MNPTKAGLVQAVRLIEKGEREKSTSVYVFITVGSKEVNRLFT
jgi:hypothetical protein